MKFTRSNNLLTGLILGLITPCFGLILVYGLFELLVQSGMMDPASMALSDKRMRTIFIISICSNIIWIRQFNKPFQTRSLKGVMISTMVYCLFWFAVYFSSLYV